MPQLHDDCFIANTATIIGDVEIGSKSSIWFGTVIRGDVFYIRIGCNSNIQDNCVIHVTTNKYPTIIGNNVTIGHSVTLHGCNIHNNVLIGIGSVIMDGCEVEEWSIVSAGSVVKPGTIISSKKLWGGIPAKEIRNLSDNEIKWIQQLSDNYVSLSREYLEDIRYS